MIRQIRQSFLPPKFSSVRYFLPCPATNPFLCGSTVANRRISFSKEIQSLHSQVKRKRSPIVRQLHLFLDQSDYLRCGGRIHNAPVNTDTKFLYLSRMNHHLTKLLVHSIHKQHLHAGVNSTVTALRQRYWVPSARQLVRRLLHKCVPCLKTTGKPYSSPESPPLLHARTQEGRPFEETSVDFTKLVWTSLEPFM